MIEKTHILVVEDEAILGMDMIGRLNKLGYATLPLASNPEKALEILSKTQPDILMLDIHLGNKHIDGIELATEIKKKYDLPFIFLTSHADEHYIERAKVVKPSAYILKPFRDKEIGIAIEVALANFSGGQHSGGQHSGGQHSGGQRSGGQHSGGQRSNTLTINDSLFLKKGDHFERVKFEQILWLEADGNYTEIQTTSATYIYSTILKKIETSLPKDQFFRVHRSYIVNRRSITGFSGNMLMVKDHKIPVSKQHREMVFGWFNTI